MTPEQFKTLVPGQHVEVLDLGQWIHAEVDYICLQKEGCIRVAIDTGEVSFAVHELERLRLPAEARALAAEDELGKWKARALAAETAEVRLRGCLERVMVTVREEMKP